MWRDDRELSQELATAGAAARHRMDGGSMPSAAFASDLRRRLVAQVPPPVVAQSRRWSFASRAMRPTRT